MAKIGLVGAGSWGTALSLLLADNGHDLTVWSCIEEEIEMLKTKHEQTEKLPGIKLPDTIKYTMDLKETLADKDVVVLAVPSPFTRSTAKQMAPHVRYGQLIVSVSKGIEEETLMTLSDVIGEEIPSANVAVLCGPSHAEEVGKRLPTTVVCGARNKETAEYVQNIFMSRVFRVYTSPDMLGMQLGASLKNVIALAAGMADGLGYGDNLKAALITRGLREIVVLATKMGAKAGTVNGLTGIGDLIVTCASMHSRNRRAGILIGQGKSMEEAMKEVNQIVEGVYSAKGAKKLAEKYGVELPIIDQVNEILFNGKEARQAVDDLMLRDRKKEIDELEW